MTENNNSKDLNSYNNQFNLTLNGYEGPIDLLLDLAKKQQVNLSDISILDLAEQYLNFIQKFKELHLEIAADYLVMASWLTYLKSRLLLPQDSKEDEYTSDELEAALKYQIQRLEAMQNISKVLFQKPIIGKETFYRGLIDEIKTKYQITYVSSLYELLKTYSSIIKQKDVSPLTITSSDLFSVEQAIQRLKNIFGTIDEWTNFINIIPELKGNTIVNKSVISSNFVASLELAKNGFIEVKQTETFGNIFIKTRSL